jgi:multiple sugar transport system permease protein
MYYFPIGFSAVLSFFKWSFFNNKFIGLANYVRVFTDSVPMEAYRNTVEYVLVTVLAVNALALLIALAVKHLSMAVSQIYKVIYFIPSVVSVSAISLIWSYIYHPQVGILNYVIGFFGIPHQGWLVDPRIALFSIILIGIWQNVGFYVVIYAAGLTSIDESYYDAARMDGVNPFQSFRYITFPLLTPTTIFAMVTSVILSFRVFIPVFVLTDGGPTNSTNVVVYEIYSQGLAAFRFGYASALAMTLLVFVAVLTFVQLRVTKSVEEIY